MLNAICDTTFGPGLGVDVHGTNLATDVFDVCWLLAFVNSIPRCLKLESFDDGPLHEQLRPLCHVHVLGRNLSIRE